MTTGFPLPTCGLREPSGLISDPSRYGIFTRIFDILFYKNILKSNFLREKEKMNTHIVCQDFLELYNEAFNNHYTAEEILRRMRVKLEKYVRLEQDIPFRPRNPGPEFGQPIQEPKGLFAPPPPYRYPYFAEPKKLEQRYVPYPYGAVPADNFTETIREEYP
jgi:hypothetical protein